MPINFTLINPTSDFWRVDSPDRPRGPKIGRYSMVSSLYVMASLPSFVKGRILDEDIFVHETKIAVPYVNIVIPVPGTRLHRRYEAEGRMLVQDENEFAEKNPLYSVPCGHCLFRPKSMSVPELEERIVLLTERLSRLPEVLRRSMTARCKRP